MYPGLAVGLDPQGYGNPDFCWLSLHDTLIWSFAGPIGAVIIVSAGTFASLPCGDKEPQGWVAEVTDFSQ
jgi:cadherin EGF LAG seven-pass G-type receptor 1